MTDYAQRLNYSFGNEDGNIERKALRIQPSDRVVCITASGDRPLNLLLDHPQSLVSVDMNRAQNALFELKRAAMQHFSFEDYLRFLKPEGASKYTKEKQLKALEPHMSTSAFFYWQSHLSDLNKGVLFQGYMERRCQFFSKFFQFLRKDVLKELFAFDNLEQQKAFVDKEWDRFWWKGLFRLSFSPSILKWLASDPGLYENVKTPIPPGLYFYKKMKNSLHHILAKENPFLHLLFSGSVPESAFLSYLTEPAVNQILKSPSQVEIQTENIIRYLESSPKNTFSVFSLSDVASYMPQESFERLLKAMIHSSQKNARFCLRQFFSNHTIPASLQKYIQQDTGLEGQLEKQEPFFFYRFLIGTLRP